jgi:hypothetical protein
MMYFSLVMRNGFCNFLLGVSFGQEIFSCVCFHLDILLLCCQDQAILETEKLMYSFNMHV